MVILTGDSDALVKGLVPSLARLVRISRISAKWAPSARALGAAHTRLPADTGTRQVWRRCCFLRHPALPLGNSTIAVNNRHAAAPVQLVAEGSLGRKDPTTACFLDAVALSVTQGWVSEQVSADT
jgi:hypothetical protein